MELLIPKKYMRLKTASKQYDIPTRTFYDLFRNGSITKYKIKTGTFVSVVELERLFKNGIAS